MEYYAPPTILKAKKELRTKLKRKPLHWCDYASNIVAQVSRNIYLSQSSWKHQKKQKNKNKKNVDRGLILITGSCWWVPGWWATPDGEWTQPEAQTHELWHGRWWVTVQMLRYLGRCEEEPNRTEALSDTGPCGVCACWKGDTTRAWETNFTTALGRAAARRPGVSGQDRTYFSCYVLALLNKG